MKKMTALEFMDRKNAILEELTGEILIPSDQLRDVVALPLGKVRRIAESDVISDASICPYCVKYIDKSLPEAEECTRCPMFLHDNWCNDDPEESYSTYNIVIAAVKEANEDYRLFIDVPEIKALVDEYNSQFEIQPTQEESNE